MEEKYDKIRGLCKNIQLTKGKLSDEYLFTLDAVDTFFYKNNIGAMDIRGGFTDGSNDGGIDFIYSDGETMFLVQGKSTTNLSIEDIECIEINEAFASVVMAWLKETGYDHARTNVNGGAIALGHPLGASGAKLMTTLLHELERTGGRYGLQTMCEGGGQANVTIIERL